MFASTPIACASNDDAVGSGGSSSSGTTDADSSTSLTTSSTNTSSSSASTSSTTSDDSTTTGTTAVDTGSSDGPGSSSGADCPAGTIDCPCGADDTCDEGTVCVADVCEAAVACGIDGYEPNDSQDSAVDLGTLGDGDDPGSIAGELDHALDVDWFTYQGEDNVGLPPGVAPSRMVIANGGLRLCKFLACADDGADAEVTCPPGSEAANAPGGQPGCCAPGSLSMSDFNCAGSVDDSAQVWIRIDQAAEQCVEYTVNYEF
jgi:hypothetical protein